MTTNSNKPTVLFWIIGVFALLWNLIGVFQYLSQAYITDEIKATLPPEDIVYMNNVPSWVIGAYAIAVFSATVACIAFLMKKKWATYLFIISLVAVLAQVTYNLFIQDFIPLEGGRVIMPIVILAIALFLVFFSTNADKKGYLS